jgi:phenylacetate-CoA ligase
MPLIRYRTGDIGTLDIARCGCGRTTARLKGLRGRRDDMLIIRGVNVHPSTVEHVLLSAGGVAPHYRLIAERAGVLDELTVECEPAAGTDPGQLKTRLEILLRDQAGLRITVRVLDPGTLPRSAGKAVRVIDKRST